MKDKNHYALGLRLNKEDMKRFDFIKEKIRRLKIKRGEIPHYGVISKSDVVRECLKMVFNYFFSEEYKNVEMLRELKIDILRDKIKLFEMQGKEIHTE